MLATAGVGVVVQPPEQASLRELLSLADLQLYRAKSAGRGQYGAEFDTPADV